MGVIKSEFKNAVKANVGNTWEVLYTAPAGETSFFLGLSAACVTTDGVQVSVRMYDASASEYVFIVKDAPVMVGSAAVIFSDLKLTLEEGDSVEVQCVTPGHVVDVVGSVSENVNLDT